LTRIFKEASSFLFLEMLKNAKAYESNPFAMEIITSKKSLKE
jgi:hypothetical protein